MNHDELQTQLLQEAVRWLRFQSIEKAKAAVASLLDAAPKMMAFEMTDGVNSVRTIGARVGVSPGTVSKWWSAWFSAGILFKQDGTYKKLFSLSDLGLEAPTVATPKRNGASATAAAQL
jgi:hypothetical protein